MGFRRLLYFLENEVSDLSRHPLFILGDFSRLKATGGRGLRLNRCFFSVHVGVARPQFCSALLDWDMIFTVARTELTMRAWTRREIALAGRNVTWGH